MSLHTLGPFVVTGSGTFQLDGLVDAGADPSTVELLMHASGEPDFSFNAIQSVEPMMSLTTTDIKTAIDKFQLSGIFVPNGATYTGIEQYWTQYKQHEFRESGAAHFKLASVSGMLIPQQLTVEQGGQARMTCEFHCTYDGTNPIWTPSNNVALPATILIDEAFTLGPIWINGSQLAVHNVQGVTIDWGIQVEKVWGSGEVAPRRAHGNQRAMSVAIRTNRTLLLNDFGLSGTQVGAAEVHIYLRKYKKDGDRVPDATAEHIKITAFDQQGLIFTQGVRASNNQVADAGLTIRPHKGTSAILSFNTAIAITS